MPLTPVRINCGGSAFNDTATGKNWAADYGASGGSTGPSGTTVTCIHPTETVIYQASRWGNFTYTIPVASGNYKVTLKFAETYWGGAGSRKFNVILNGTQVLTNLDLYAAAGGKNIAIDYCFTVSGVTTITIQLVTVTDNAVIMGIDIVDATTPAVFFGVNPGGKILVVSQTQQFNAVADYAPSVTWSISPNVGSISSTGLYTAPATITSNQTITVTAAETGNPSSNGSTTLTLWKDSVGGEIVRLPLTGNIYNEIRLFPNSFSVVSTGIPNSVVAYKNITGYNSVTGSGDRRAIINITASAITLIGTINGVVDGSRTDTNAYFYGSASVTGLWVQFDFLDRSVVTEAIYYQSTAASQGTWQWQGSNDAVSWTSIGSSFALGGATTQVITTLSGNTTGYRYYRILGVSGSSSSTPYANEFEFKSDFDPTETYSYLKLGGTGDRRSIIIATSSGLSYGSGSASQLINGTALNDCWFSGSSVGAYLQWDFGTSIVVNEATWTQSTTTAMGTWQFQGSNNATTWTNLGSTFTLGGSMIQTINIGGNTTAYRYYRILLISGGTSSAPWLYEMQFKIGDGMPTPLLARGGNHRISTIRLNYGVLQTSVLPSVTVPHGLLKVTGTVPTLYKYTVIPPGFLKVHGSIPVPVTFTIPPVLVPHGVLKLHGSIPTPRARGVTWVTVPHGVLKIIGIAPVPNPIIEPVLVPRGNVIVSGKTLTPVGYSVPPPSTEVGGNRSGNRIIYHF